MQAAQVELKKKKAGKQRTLADQLVQVVKRGSCVDVCYLLTSKANINSCDGAG